MSTPFKMRGFSGFGNSPITKKTKFWDKVKSAGKGVIAALTATDEFAQSGAAEYRRSKAEYRAKSPANKKYTPDEGLVAGS